MFRLRRIPKNGGPMGGDDSDDERWFESPAMWWNPIAWLIALFVEEEIHLHGPNEYHISEPGFALVILLLGAIFITFLVVSGNL